MKRFFSNTYSLFRHEFLLVVRNPFWLFFGLFEPVIYLLLFAPFLNGVVDNPEFPGGNTIQFFAPGLLIMTAMFNTAYSGFGLLDKLDSGFIERLRVTPVSRFAIVLGFVLENTMILVIQSFILIVVSLFFGLHLSIIGSILLFILLILIGITITSCSYSLALIVKDGGMLSSAISFFMLPLFLLSGVMLPLSFAPAPIQFLARFNPFAYSVDAARALMNGAIFDPSVLTGFGLFIIIAISATIWFVRVMREAVA